MWHVLQRACVAVSTVALLLSSLKSQGVPYTPALWVQPVHHTLHTTPYITVYNTVPTCMTKYITIHTCTPTCMNPPYLTPTLHHRCEHCVCVFVGSRKHWRTQLFHCRVSAVLNNSTSQCVLTCVDLPSLHQGVMWVGIVAGVIRATRIRPK